MKITKETKMTNKIENKIIEYIKIMYKKHNREIDITEIRFSNTEWCDWLK